MELFIKHFTELSTEELYDIIRVRLEVFVVEQSCHYQDADNADKQAYHIFIKDADGIAAYARLLPSGIKFPFVSLGRVLTVKRGKGLGSEIVMHGIDAAKRLLCADSITIEAQSYAQGFYEKHGFVKASDEFLEDGIPHIKMTLDLKNHR